MSREFHKVVITGFGWVTPLGDEIEPVWQSLLSGASGAGPITRFDVSEYPTKIAAEVKDFDPTEYISKKDVRRLDLSEQYAVVAAQKAVDHARLDVESLDLDRAGVVIGSGIGGISTFEQQHMALLESGPGRVSPFFIPMMISNMCAGAVGMRFGFRGPNYCTVSACASSSHAIADVYRMVQRGDLDVALAGGAEATITPTSLAGFCSARAMTTRNEEPERASRPFDKDRDGFLMGEGSGIMVIESEEHARARGATIYGRIVGAGLTCDAYHMTAPRPDGYGARKAMMNAVADAGIALEDVSLINTHGTSTGLGDIAETKAIKEVFGDHARQMLVNSTKSMLGHLLGSAGAVEAIATTLSLRDGRVHPTINLENQDPECDLDYVANSARELDMKYAITNSFGFGGHNVSLLLAKANGAA
ncbi:MAG TPA: beta-ketoacyl-ACP synthase II [candidate division Zixibacteria bacterium]|nr:beta-ketoacyl-ACP synthase II [candidate division Zixibacteria bacterium]